VQASQLQESGGTVRTAVVNVCDNTAHDAAIKHHVAAYNSLDLVVLNAGIGERTDFLTSPDRSWEVTLDVDLRAVLVGVQSAARAMMQTGKPGSIVSVASAAGNAACAPVPLWPFPSRCNLKRMRPVHFPRLAELGSTTATAAAFAWHQLVHAHCGAGQAATTTATHKLPAVLPAVLAWCSLTNP
jgi:NAD(P)-dependent dehydrogenase (short-subunit alcohol dehydrogenase family)